MPPTEAVPAIQIVRGAGRNAEREPPAEPEAGIPSDADALMPDLSGKSLRQALALLGALDVDVAVAGRGIVVRQTPGPGHAARPRRVVPAGAGAPGRDPVTGHGPQAVRSGRSARIRPSPLAELG